VWDRRGYCRSPTLLRRSQPCSFRMRISLGEVFRRSNVKRVGTVVGVGLNLRTLLNVMSAMLGHNANVKVWKSAGYRLYEMKER
jgi:hypothetical protein